MSYDSRRRNVPILRTDELLVWVRGDLETMCGQTRLHSRLPLVLIGASRGRGKYHPHHHPCDACWSFPGARLVGIDVLLQTSQGEETEEAVRIGSWLHRVALDMPHTFSSRKVATVSIQSCRPENHERLASAAATSLRISF